LARPVGKRVAALRVALSFRRKIAAMRWVILVCVCLGAGGCGATPSDLAFGLGGAGVASVAILHRSPFDALWSLATGRDCSVVRLDKGESWCRPEEPPPEEPIFCTRSLGTVDCWREPAALPGHPRGVADGPRTLTPVQEADRTRRWGL